MPRILLNGADHMTAPEPRCWGDLLGVIDQALQPSGTIVTDVRIDGIDEPAFRDPLLLERALADVAVLEIEAGTPASLMERTLREAAASVDSLGDAAEAIGESFRGHDLGPANNSLAQLGESLRSVVGIVGAAGLAFHVNLGQVRCGGDRTVSSMVAELTGFVDDLIAAQGIGDWITVADVLQYDVAPALRRWGPMLEELQPLVRR